MCNGKEFNYVVKLFSQFHNAAGAEQKKSQLRDETNKIRRRDHITAAWGKLKQVLAGPKLII